MLNNEAGRIFMFEVIFLRHGESVGVQNKVLQGHVDFPLTANGRTQIQTLADFWLKNQQTFDRVFTSPLKRARETSEIIASVLGIPEVYEEPLWMERDFGKGEGVDLQVIADWYQSKPHPTVFEPIYETGETEWQVHQRASSAIEKLMTLPEGRYLIVSHGNVINAALHTIFGLLPYGRSQPVRLALDTGCYAKLEYQLVPGRWSLIQFNDHLHDSHDHCR
jgi:broad specificity phosphatase PhoE